jgi:hypothetical protein
LPALLVMRTAITSTSSIIVVVMICWDLHSFPALTILTLAANSSLTDSQTPINKQTRSHRHPGPNPGWVSDMPLYYLLCRISPHQHDRASRSRYALADSPLL